MRNLLPKIILGLLLAAMFFSRAARADTVMSLEILRIADQGDQLAINWKFTFNLLPSTFVLTEKNSETISLQDPATLNQNLLDFISVGFDIRVDGQPVKAIRIEKLVVNPDRSCSVVLIYPGHPRAHVEVRSPVLHYFPSTYYTYFEAYNVKALGAAKTGFLGLNANSQPVIEFTQLASDGTVVDDTPKPDSVSAASFKAEIRSAWVNCNWLLICVVLLLMQMPKRVCFLVASMVVCWILQCMLWVFANYKFPWHIPEVVLSVPTVLLCFVAVRHPKRVVWLTVIALAAGMLNACFDVQQIPLENIDKAVPALSGLLLGFVGGMGLVLIVLVPLLWECKKYPPFQAEWAPKICWVVAAIAIIVPVQKFFFG